MEIDHPDSSDTDRIVELWIDLARGQRKFGSHLLAEPNRKQIRDAVGRHIIGDRLLVAEDLEIHGFVMFRMEGEQFEQEVSRGLVENLYVTPEYRDQGIGSELLKRAEEVLVERDAETVTLEVMAPNEAARRFYRARGYEPHRIELEKEIE